MMKIFMPMIFSLSLFFFFNKFNKFIIMFFLFFCLIFMNFYSSMWIGGMNMFYTDLYSFNLMVMSFYLIGCIMLMKLSKFMKLMIYILLNLLILCFSTLNMMMFYILFEMSLLPIFFMMMFGGYTFERFEAMMYMFLYTIISSMPFLWCILKLFIQKNSLSMIFLMINFSSMGWLMFYIFLLTFLIKVPLFLFHIWLPKAHVEAPVYGSMLLAGVLLKLGSYGILRIVQIFFIDVLKFSSMFMSLSIIGSILTGFMCLVQVDMKMLVAYSSVVHMGLMVSGLLTLTNLGLIGSMIMMIAHGICSSGLFYLVNLSYEKFGSRVLMIIKGSLNIFPKLSLFWFMMCSANLGAPVSLNLIGELMLLMSLMSWELNLMIFLMILSMVSASYSLYLFSFTQHGKKMKFNLSYETTTINNYMMLFFHLLPLNIMFFMVDIYV